MSWNCAMGFTKKQHLIEALQPDIAVLAEVSLKAMTDSDAPFKTWVGSNPNKGLGVLGFTDRTYFEYEAGQLLPWHIPFSVDGMNIIALWAHVRTRDLRYVRVTHEIVNRQAEFLRHPRSLLIGDFNSSTLWDKLHPGRNHSILVNKLEQLGLHSVYHRQENAAQGSELHPTFFGNRNPKKPHHIDYAFLSADTSANLEIGRLEAWLAHSDHMPLILDVDRSSSLLTQAFRRGLSG
ncbi:endonuclease/exonuclease/phosphatase family protein [Arthrobacter sp. TMN-50]